MNTAFLASMQEALNLVKAGQLMQATTAIQHALQGQTPSSPTSTTGSDERVVEGEVIRSHTATVNPTPAVAPVLAGLKVPTADFKQWLGQWQDQLSGLPIDLPNPVLHTPKPAKPLPAGAQFLDKHYRNAHGGRDYKLYIPSHYQGQAMPLVIMLHGCTQSADDFAAGTAMNALAEEFGCLIAYPNQAQAANPNRCWNWFKPQDQQRDQGEPAILAGLTQAIMADYQIDAKRVYIAGLSAGGAMAAVMASAYPDVYAAVGVHSGLPAGSANDLVSALTAMRQGSWQAHADQRLARFVPTIVFHGDQDATVHTQNGEQIFGHAKARLHASNDDYFNVDKQRHQPDHGHAYTRTCLQAADGHTQIEHWLIHGAGHAWAGGCTDGSYTDPHGPDASSEMLRFFLSHPR